MGVLPHQICLRTNPGQWSSAVHTRSVGGGSPVQPPCAVVYSTACTLSQFITRCFKESDRRKMPQSRLKWDLLWTERAPVCFLRWRCSSVPRLPWQQSGISSIEENVRWCPRMGSEPVSSVKLAITLVTLRRCQDKSGS